MQHIGLLHAQKATQPACHGQVEVAAKRQFDDARPGCAYHSGNGRARRTDQHVLVAGLPREFAQQENDLQGAAVKMATGLQVQDLHQDSSWAICPWTVKRLSAGAVTSVAFISSSARA